MRPPMAPNGHLRRSGILFLCALFIVFAAGAGPQLVSVGTSPLPVSNGDSSAPLPSFDGRYVVFASSATDLLVTSNGNPILSTAMPYLNVFLRDRSNATTVLVSVNLSGVAGGNGDSIPTAISPDGRFVLFESTASNLVSNDTKGLANVFIRNMESNVTSLVSIGTNGVSANGSSRGSTLSPDGLYIAFVSEANNLVNGDTNGIADVFVRSLPMNNITLASPGATSRGGQDFFLNSSESPALTSLGTYVCFFSTATNLVPGVDSSGDIYVRSLLHGTTAWASSGARAALQTVTGATNGVSFSHVISDHGDCVVYEASPIPPTGASGIILRYNVQTDTTEIVHTNAFVPSGNNYHTFHTLDITSDGTQVAFVANTNGTSGTTTCILLWNSITGKTTLESGDLNNQVPANTICQWPSFTSQPTILNFLSSAGNLTGNPLVGEYHLYQRNTLSDTTTLIDADTNGIGSGVGPQSIPSGTRRVAFEAVDGTLASNDRNRNGDIFVRDLDTSSTDLVSARDPGLPSSSPDGWSTLSPVSVSADGRYVAFSSEADNLVDNDFNGVRDVFVRDLVAGTNIPVSVATNGAMGDNYSLDASISGDGRYVAFTSGATNLVAGDANKALDVFVRDLQTGTTILVSVSTNGTSGNGASFSPIMSADGGHVLFGSRASNLAPGTSSGSNLFLRDLQTGTTYALTVAGTGFTINPASNGRFILYVGGIPTAGLYLWDSQVQARVSTNTFTGILAAPGVSPDGNRILFIANNQWRAADRLANTNWGIGFAGSSSLLASPQFSADGHYAAFGAGANFINQIYLYDWEAKTNILLSTPYYTSGAANGACYAPNISSDGRFVAWYSIATNLVPGDSNAAADVFLYDRLSGATTLLSVSRFANLSADNRSLTPVFSSDGRILAFQSWASDLVPFDLNRNSDVFALNLYPSNSIAPFTVQVFPPPTIGRGPTLSWAVVSGRSYAVQFKNALDDSSWQPATGDVSLVGNQGYYTETAPAGAQKFYRVVGY